MNSLPLPKLPGYTINNGSSLSPKSKNDYKKKQTLTYKNGYAKNECLMLANELDVQNEDLAINNGITTLDKFKNEFKQPKWIEFDNKVLRFYGYFKESVVESVIENYRIRKLIIYYYLSDDTIHMAEPKEDNSGLSQGIFIKRHKIKKSGNTYYTALDFEIGTTVTLYGKCIHIINCDKFTREHYENNYQIKLKEALDYPEEPIIKYKNIREKKMQCHGPPNPRNDSLTRFTEAKLGKASNVLEEDRLKYFLEHDREVLRFYCIWDDRDNIYGDKRLFVLHYYLGEEKGEILEKQGPNSGRDAFPIFLKKGPLFKDSKAYITATAGNKANRDVFKPCDFKIGSILKINNRDFFLFDCDPFTKDWYKSELGFNDSQLKAIQINNQALNVQSIKRNIIPPYNGYGSHEDSLQNCISLNPKPPKKDFLKLMNKDRIALRFAAKLINTQKYELDESDKHRRFILTYFMADDTISIFEPAVQNSGISSGKFLERSKIPKPILNPKTNTIYYKYCDLHVGAILDVHGRRFLLEEADEYTYTYMENNKHIFLMADIDILMESLGKQLRSKDNLRRIIEKYSINDKLVDGNGLINSINELGLKYSDHQCIALKRWLQRERNNMISIDDLIKMMFVE